jgi:dipeptidyl aminopeptidase/acylaminoacyl peptidase
MTELPYGTWPSPITPETVVEDAVRLAHLAIDPEGEKVYWVEGRPAEAGREVLVGAALAGGKPHDVLPEEFSVRTQVHEYGGRCYAVRGDLVVFSNWSDQRLWIACGDADPQPLTPEPGHPRSVRYADPTISPDTEWVVCVRETHRAGTVDNELVAVSLGQPAGPDRVVASGRDFYSAPRFSPDGGRLCWITWDHPRMPWDGTELWVSPFPDPAGATKVAGGPEESVTQPRWSPAGRLHFASDRTGWWNLYDEAGTPLCPMDAEFAGPDWVFGNSDYGFAPDGKLAATWTAGGVRRLGFVEGGRAEARDVPLTNFAYVTPVAGAVYAIAGSPTEAPAVVRIDGTRVEVLKRSRESRVDHAHLSHPEAIEFPTGAGGTAHALFYPPTHAEVRGPEGERPPVIVVLHGGPTGSTTAVLNLGLQYWTNRGLAVVDVDYRGSSGYGRPYRQLLNGSWGVADVEDCAAVVDWLADRGRVDGDRAAIRGGSAGGFTTLAALAFTDRFSAGASLYGVADLELLARETHKFESRYTDRLVGRWPEEAAEYRRRSPIHHADQISSPLILFQGLEDKVVPPEQSQLMFDALKERGVPVAYLTLEGEQHGFRKAETVVAVMEAELDFYGRVLGFKPAGSRPAVPIANEELLPSQ